MVIKSHETIFSHYDRLGESFAGSLLLNKSRSSFVFFFTGNKQRDR